MELKDRLNVRVTKLDDGFVHNKKFITAVELHETIEILVHKWFKLNLESPFISIRFLPFKKVEKLRESDLDEREKKMKGDWRASMIDIPEIKVPIETVSTKNISKESKALNYSRVKGSKTRTKELIKTEYKTFEQIGVTSYSRPNIVATFCKEPASGINTVQGLVESLIKDSMEPWLLDYYQKILDICVNIPIKKDADQQTEHLREMIQIPDMVSVETQVDDVSLNNEISNNTIHELQEQLTLLTGKNKNMSDHIVKLKKENSDLKSKLIKSEQKTMKVDNQSQTDNDDIKRIIDVMIKGKIIDSPGDPVEEITKVIAKFREQNMKLLDMKIVYKRLNKYGVKLSEVILSKGKIGFIHLICNILTHYDKILKDYYETFGELLISKYIDCLT